MSVSPSSTVLVISADAASRQALRASLGAARFRVFDAADAREGMEAFWESRPEVVLLDVAGAGPESLEFCETLAKEQTAAHVPVVILAGAEDLNVIRMGHRVGVADLIVKPVPDKLLEHRLRFLLAASAERRHLAHSLARMEDAQRLAQLGTWEWSLATRSLEFSDEARRILGISKGGTDVTVDKVLRNVPAEDRPRVRTWLEEASQSGFESTIEHRVSQFDGSERIVRQRAAVAKDPSGVPQRISVVVSDITEWRQVEAENRYQAHHDLVTGLENLERFVQRLDEASWVAQRFGGRFAIFYLGIARFGRIHESMGHRFGDGVLKRIAERLQSWLRKTDWVCHVPEERRIPRVARLDGAHFSILLQPVHRVEDMARVASRINETFAEPIIFEGKELFLSTNIGIAIYPDDAGDPDELMQRAQTAMRRAQSEGRAEPHFSTAQMTEEAAERLSLEASLRHALERDQLEAYYQPKVEIATGQIAGMEALLRWRHPDLGIVLPGKFIQVAEETGVIVPMGEWVLRTACRQAKTWQDAGHRPFPVAVNVSVEQFRRADLVDLVVRTVEETGLAPKWLEIELTESVLMDDIDCNLVILRELKSLGVLLSIDDFGTGYSSLSYLRRFPIDVLKIDRSFVSDLSTDADADAIATTIVHMARSLGLKVIAEGVETEEQLAFLRELGCDEYQGYLFSRPVPAAAATAQLEKERVLAGARGSVVPAGEPVAPTGEP